MPRYSNAGAKMSWAIGLQSVVVENCMTGIRKNGEGGDARMASAHLGERREVRYTLPIEVKLIGLDRNGEVFHERTFTRNVSGWGCVFLLSIELKTEDIFALRAISPDAREMAQARQSLFQVVRATPEGNGWLVAAWKMDEGNPWGNRLESLAEPEEGNRELRKSGAANRRERTLKVADR